MLKLFSINVNLILKNKSYHNDIGSNNLQIPG